MDDFPVGQAALAQRRVNKHLVGIIWKCQETVMRHAKAPRFLIIGGSIRDDAWLIRKREYVRTQLPQAIVTAHGYAVVHDMKVAPLEINDSLAAAILYVGVPNVPLFRNDPIEYRCA